MQACSLLPHFSFAIILKTHLEYFSLNKGRPNCSVSFILLSQMTGVSNVLRIADYIVEKNGRPTQSAINGHSLRNPPSSQCRTNKGFKGIFLNICLKEPSLRQSNHCDASIKLTEHVFPVQPYLETENEICFENSVIKAIQRKFCFFGAVNIIERVHNFLRNFALRSQLHLSQCLSGPQYHLLTGQSLNKVVHCILVHMSLDLSSLM